ncbi:uncharacterized protein N7482_003717 [Penicillium canariense]|uniref:Flo11 n=1 Tax=Penicillium canariense TaxID=189055 RepID=A0A9W9I795_9EURO|nr:uncharacterized protein N7482_003717 [Penicillium canariense]KAJ5168123.1 hypothetical protein N7482_003717 [Penicillium canariense]
MQHYKGSDFLDAGTLCRSRSSTSLSSDSQHPRVNLMAPPSVRPPPAFISSSAASEIITSDQEFNTADFVADDEETGAGANALVTPAALALLNSFLDNLLFNVLAGSKSTQLACIRPALADVLKPRLASEVVATADEELSEYMGGAEDEQAEFRGGQEPGGDFDLVRSWRLTRLRCMVYTRLGDMEEEDEDEFIAQEGLGETEGAPRRFTSHVNNITPAAAIFLTSIIEYIGERALVIAGETARSRLSASLNDSQVNAADEQEEEDRKRIDRLVVEDLDMEKLALNATLGRLWRTWRKRRRNTTLSRTLSHESFRRRGYNTLANSRKSSIATIEEPLTPQDPLPEEIPAPVDPATVPLPMGDYDVQEIEVPGYSAELEGEVQTMQAMVAHKVRPRSLMVLSSPSLAPKSPGSSNGSPVSAGAIDNAKSLRHARSRSLPNAAASPPRQVPQADHAATADQPSPSTSEEKRQLETMYEDDESAEYVDAEENAPGIAITTSHEEALKQSAAESAEKDRMSVVQEEEEEPPASPPAAASAAVAAPPVNETVASLRSLEDEDDDVTTDHSAGVLVASLGDSPTKDPEVIEGRGMCEKPTLTSTIQRPRRKPSRDPALLNAKPIFEDTSESDMQSVVEKPPATQGAESTPAPSAASIEAINSPGDNSDVGDGDQNKSAMTSTPAIVPEIKQAMPKEPQEPQGPTVEKSTEPTETTKPTEQNSDAQELADISDSSYPVSATESERSERSRRHRPSPLVVTASNRTSSNRSSPTVEQRAAVQRMPRPNTSVSSSIQVKTRRSDSVGSARDKRPVTAGSTTSQVSSKLKGFMNRPPGESPSLRLRSSSETSRASGSAGSVDNDATDLDKLINSDETIHFTLTPRSVREMTFPDIPRPIPRSDTTNTTDLADFIKNTGPPGEDPRSQNPLSSRHAGDRNFGHTKSAESPKHIPIASRVSLHQKPSATGQAREPRSTDMTSSPVRPPSSLSTSTTNTSRLTPQRTRLQARPAETRGSQTSELIDFIREGPPQPGAHRIPRTVAPFRNTIDSDDLQFESSQNEKDHTTSSSFASSRDGSTPSKSLTSFGSRTGLLDSANRGNDQTKFAPTSAAMQDDTRPVPVRKQRRVPGRASDPYAIDDDDDDDDLLHELISAKPPQREEESLMDFLRSTPPPDIEQSQPQPLNITIPSYKPIGFASSTSMKSRLMRSTTSADKSPSSKMSISSLRSQSTLNSQPPQASNYSYKVGRERNPATIPSASNRQTETSALADFLRNTGPPEPPAGRAGGSKAKEGGFSRFFVRRRKVEV